jgi:hypothetical protein
MFYFVAYFGSFCVLMRNGNCTLERHAAMDTGNLDNLAVESRCTRKVLASELALDGIDLHCLIEY